MAPFATLAIVKLLFLTISSAPDRGPHQVSNIASYPGVLINGPTSIFRHSPMGVHDAEKEIELKQPDILVFIGEKSQTKQWKQIFQDTYPKLFILESNSSDWYELLDDINQRVWSIRHKRVQPSKAAWPIQCVDESEMFNQMEIGKRKSALALAQIFIKTYHLQPLMKQVSTPVFERILYCMDLLEQTFKNISLPSNRLELIDVGIKEWSYAPALRYYLKIHAQEIQLTGIELDPYFYDKSGYTQLEQAQHYANLTQARLVEGDFINTNESAHIITHFLPVILPENALRWRIPLKYHRPHQLLEKTWNTLRPGGMALFYNGVNIEYQKTIELFHTLGLTPLKSEKHTCRFRQEQRGLITLLRKQEVKI